MSSQDFLKLSKDCTDALLQLDEFINGTLLPNKDYEAYKDIAIKFEALLFKIPNLKLSEITSEAFQTYKCTASDYIHRIVALLVEEKCTCKDIVSAYIERLLNPVYSFQGGFGHSVRNQDWRISTGLKTHNGRIPHHWVVRPVYYELCKPTPLEKLCMIVDKRDIQVSPTAAMERWGD